MRERERESRCPGRRRAPSTSTALVRPRPLAPEELPGAARVCIHARAQSTTIPTPTCYSQVSSPHSSLARQAASPLDSFVGGCNHHHQKHQMLARAPAPSARAAARSNRPSSVSRLAARPSRNTPAVIVRAAGGSNGGAWDVAVVAVVVRHGCRRRRCHRPRANRPRLRPRSLTPHVALPPSLRPKTSHQAQTASPGTSAASAAPSSSSTPRASSASSAASSATTPPRPPPPPAPPLPPRPPPRRQQ